MILLFADKQEKKTEREKAVARESERLVSNIIIYFRLFSSSFLCVRSERKSLGKKLERKENENGSAEIERLMVHIIVLVHQVLLNIDIDRMM